MPSEKPSKRPDPTEALKNLERPQIKWKIVAQIGAAFALLWAIAIGMVSYAGDAGYWAVGAVGILTAVAIGFGIYVLRMMKKSQSMVDILRTATDAEGRKAALQKLEMQDAGKSDAMNALARAQLVAQEDPAQAVAILEAVDIPKAPAIVQDDVRANLALLYLMTNRARDARTLADDIKVDGPRPEKAKGLLAAVVAESFARTGKADAARTLLEKFDPEAPDHAELRPLLLRAQVYTFVATKNRGLARKAMEKLAEIDPNTLAPFVMKGAPPELTKMARELLVGGGHVPRPKMKMKMR